MVYVEVRREQLRRMRRAMRRMLNRKLSLVLEQWQYAAGVLSAERRALSPSRFEKPATCTSSPISQGMPSRDTRKVPSSLIVKSSSRSTFSACVTAELVLV